MPRYQTVVYQTVVTFQAPGGALPPEISLCAQHQHDGVTRRAPNGAEFCTVSHGAHRGVCDVCDPRVEG